MEVFENIYHFETQYFEILLCNAATPRSKSILNCYHAAGSVTKGGKVTMEVLAGAPGPPGPPGPPGYWVTIYIISAHNLRESSKDKDTEVKAASLDDS
jgi:hypothetical protein